MLTADDHFQRGNELFRQGEYELALALYDRLLALRPDDPTAHYNRGIVLGMLEQFSEAVKAYDRSLALRPDEPASHYNRGIVLVGAGRNAEALAAFDRSLDLGLDDFSTHKNRGVTLAELGQHVEAVAALDRALTLRADDSDAHRLRGSSLYTLGRHAEALEAYERSLALNPNDNHTHVRRGLALRDLGRIHDALSAYNQSIELDSNEWIAFLNKGALLCDDLGRYGEAIVAFDRSIMLRPENPDAYRNRSIALEQLDPDDPQSPLGENMDPGFEAQRSRFAAVAICIARKYEGLEDSVVVAQLLNKWIGRREVPLLVYRLVTDRPLASPLAPEAEPEVEDAEAFGMQWADVLAATRPYRELARYRASGRSHLSEAEWLRILGLGAFYLGDPITALSHFDALDDLDPTDLLGQFYLVRCYDAILNESEQRGALQFALTHAREALSDRNADAEKLYYAAQVFVVSGNPEHSLRAREALSRSGEITLSGERRFLPALYLRVVVEDAIARGGEAVDIEDGPTPEATEAAIRAVLREEVALRDSGRSSFLAGIDLGQVENEDAGWDHPFRRYAHAMETLGGLDLVLRWLRKYEREHGAMPPEWRFADTDITRDHDNAWEAWELSDAFLSEIEDAVQQDVDEDTERLRRILRDRISELIDPESASDLEKAIAARIEDPRETDSARTFVHLVRYHSLMGHLEPKPALLLTLYALARNPSRQSLHEIAEEGFKTFAESLLTNPVNQILVLMGVVSGSTAVAVGTAGSSVLVHLALEFARARLNKPPSTYAQFQRDFYAYVAERVDTLKGGLKPYVRDLIEPAA